MATRKKPTTTQAPADEEVIALKGLLAGSPRQTLPINANVLGALPWMYLPRRGYQSLDLTTITPGAFSPQQLLDVLADADPNIALALWNILRLAGAAWSYEVRTPDNTQEDPEGKAVLDAVLSQVNHNWGGINNLVNQWIMSVALEGACAGETIPNTDITDVIDMVPVSPWTVFFQRDIEQNYVAYQWQPMLASGNGVLGINAASMAPGPDVLSTMEALSHGGFRRLNELTFAYIPLDTAIDDPYGRMPFAPVLQVIVFDAQLLKDLRQWSHVNAFGRLNISVLADKVKDLMPPNVANNAAQRALYYQTFLNDIQQAYNSLNPDDTFVHFDSVVVNGVDSSGKTFNIDTLIRIVERRIFRALKQLPILMGSNEGTTETWGTLQMEIYALGIANIQRVVATLLERLFNVALRIRGRASVVTVTFEALRASDRLQVAQASALEIKNAATKRDEGWITQDEAAIDVTGSKSVADAPNPDPLAALGQPDSGSDQPVPTPAPVLPNTKSVQTKNGHDAIVRAMSDLLRVHERTASASTRRTQYQQRLKNAVGKHLQKTAVPRETVDHILATIVLPKRSRYVKTRDAQKAALVSTVAQMLQEAVPDSDPDLVDLLDEFRTEGWEIAAQDAIDEIGLTGDVHLTNTAILAKIRQYVEDRAAQLQETTRNQIASTIVTGAQNGDDGTAIAASIALLIAGMGDDRADLIAEYETSNVYGDASVTTWEKNGVPQKVWATDSDPDPTAGATGPTPCRDNAYASPIPIDEDFPSGDAYPPAHARCKCDIRPSGDPSDAAQTNPWLGV